MTWKLIYIFITNFFVNLIVLKTTSFLIRARGRFFLLSALLGAGLTLVKSVVCLNQMGSLLFQVGAVVVYVCIAFHFAKISEFFQIYFAYFASALIYSGLCYFAVSYLELTSLFVVFAGVFVFYFGVKCVLKISNRRKMLNDFCFDVEVTNMGKNFKCKAFLDSGNVLFDPLTDKPVNLLNFYAFSMIFDGFTVEDVLSRSDKLKKLKLSHYITLNTLSNSDKILVFQVDKLKIGGSCFEKTMFGLSLKNFDNAFGSDMILHNEFACA